MATLFWGINAQAVRMDMVDVSNNNGYMSTLLAILLMVKQPKWPGYQWAQYWQRKWRPKSRAMITVNQYNNLGGY